MALPEVDRLRADVAVLERRLERIEKSAAFSNEVVSTLRRKLDELPAASAAAGAAGAASAAAGRAEDGAAETRALAEQVRGLRGDFDGLAERIGPLEESSAYVRRELAVLKELVQRIGDGQRAATEAAAAATAAAHAATAAANAVAANVAAASPVAANVAAAPAPSAAAFAYAPTTASLASTAPTQPAPAVTRPAEPVVTRMPAPATPPAPVETVAFIPPTTVAADPPTIPQISPPKPARRSGERAPLRNAQWEDTQIEVGRSIVLRCEAPGHPDGWPVEIQIVDDAGNRVASLDAEVAAEAVDAEWMYVYEEDQRTDRASGRFRFVARAGDLETESDLVAVRDYGPPPKKRSFADLLKSRGGR
jgi:hypothetical protein